MLYFIGLGLGDPSDITVKGLEIVRKAKRVYLESYTSILSVGKEKLEEFYGREVIVADREMVEQDADSILQNGTEEDIAFLVVGDPFGATTHTDMILRACQKSIPYKVVHNASILNAVGCCGLQLYRFGEIVSIVFWTEDWKPDSFYDKIKLNRNNGLHTLCLLDIKVKEQSIENLIKGKKIYEPPRFMTVSCAAQQLMDIIERKKAQGDDKPAYTEDTICVGLERIGSEDQRIIAAPLRRMTTVALNTPLHSLIICGDLHPVEKEMLELFAEEKGATKGDVCSLDPDIGGCSSYSQSYYFNRFTGECHEFIFGGCLGNKNNFESLEDCQAYCEGFELDKVCDKKSDRGPCEGFIWRYYYDQELEECKTFIYGGCRGNSNNFRRKSECIATCGKPNEQ